MEAERWQEVDAIFAEVLERPRDERQAFLDEACGDDASLRAEVGRLLAADERAAGFLERPAGLETAAGEEEPLRLGPYRLLHRIGSGGMGTVYLARRDDEQYERLVAVKILHSGLEATEVYHRFLAERQILARLEHPNIARLYDGGSTEEGRPFLVLELIEGLPVDVYCDRHRLTVDQRLDLFRRICGAVQYAHQNLLVHRDIKPANILVTQEGEPKLLDFGIAKQLEPGAEESGAMTRTGLRVMTPSYASPEQVKGEAITTASDVYSLGVLLYELLVGRSPYRLMSALPHEIERAICDQEPERPSQALFRADAAAEDRPSSPSPISPIAPEALATARSTRPQALSRRLRGDLDNVLLMALRKEPGRRYPSVAKLAQDLESHLRSLPVTARPDTFLYRTRKFARRHRAAVATAAAVVLLVAGFVASLIAQGRQLARERDKARYTLSFLVDTFRQADPFHTRGERLTAQEILDQGARRVSRELASQPDVQAALMDAIGQADLGLGRVDRAAPLLEGALAVRRRTLGPGSLEVARSLEQVAAVRFQRSDLKGSEALLRQSLALKRRRLGNDDVEVARTLNQLGETVATGGPRRAEPLHQQALAIARKVEGAEGPTLAASLIALARRADERGDYPAAERLFSQGLAMETRLLGEENPDVIHHQSAYASLLLGQGKFKESEAVLRRTLAVERRIVGEGHPDLAGLYNDLAVTRQAQGDLPGAEALYRQALAGFRVSFGESGSQMAETLSNLSTVLEKEEKNEEAVRLQQRALELRRHLYGERHYLVAHSLLHLAKLWLQMGQTAEALSLARQSLAMARETLGPEHPYVAYPSEALGLALRRQGEPAAAEPYLRQSVALLVKGVPSGHPELARARLELAGCLVDLGRLAEAESLLRQAEPVLAAESGPASRDLRKLHASLDEIARRRG
jgi:serine/threonine-protein kinase